MFKKNGKSLLKILIVPGLMLALLVAIFIPRSGGTDVTIYPLPEQISGGIILHAWNMSFNEIKEQLPYIAAAGFNTIQTSPIGDSIFRFPDYDGDNPTTEAQRSLIGTWWMLYQPRSFNIGNMLGTKEEFILLCKRAEEFGIHIIVDAIPNHATSWWYEISDELRRPELFHAVPGDGSEFDKNITNWGNRVDSRRSRLLGLMDFNTGSLEFQELYMEFLGSIIDAGASGFRYDAMVHIELPYPFDDMEIASDFWPNIQEFVNNRVIENGRIPFQYGEILDRWHADYLEALPEMAVTADGHGGHIRRHVIQGRLGNWDTRDFLVTTYEGATLNRFVVWVESHDTYGNDGASRNITEEQMRIGWAIITAREGTTPLFLVRPGEGFVNNGQMFIPNEDGSYTNIWGHCDFFRDSTITAINWFANYFVGQPEFTSTWNDDIALIERGEKDATRGVTIVNVGMDVHIVDFPVQMVDGEYTCQVTGNIYVVSDGRITGPDILGQEVLVIYDAQLTLCLKSF